MSTQRKLAKRKPLSCCMLRLLKRKGYYMSAAQDCLKKEYSGYRRHPMFDKGFICGWAAAQGQQKSVGTSTNKQSTPLKICCKENCPHSSFWEN